MGNYRFDWSVVDYGALGSGLVTTLLLTAVVIALSTVLAVPVALARMSEVEVVRWVAQGYIELFRCTPLLVQLFWIYFALPALTGQTLSGFTSAVIALTANQTAFLAETYRSGFQAVPVEQIEAGRMLRLTRFESVRYIVVPQALRQQLPVILSLDIALFKETALVQTIAVHDLMFNANALSSITYRPVEILTVAALIYFVVAFPASVIVSWLERRMGGLTPKRRGVLRPAAMAR